MSCLHSSYVSVLDSIFALVGTDEAVAAMKGTVVTSSFTFNPGALSSGIDYVIMDNNGLLRCP